MTVQARHHFYAVTAIVAVVWVALLRVVPDAVRDYPAFVVPFFVLVNLQITAFYFAAALMLLERAQGVAAALFTSPLQPGEYLWVKALALTVLGTSENATIVLFVFGPGGTWTWLLIGTVFLAAIYALLGLAAVAGHTALSTFLIPSIAWISAFSLPLVALAGLVPRWLLAWHPLLPPLILLEASFRPVAAPFIVSAILGSAAWCAIAFFWARSRLLGLVAPAAA